ncbi:siderophore-interacting protein [Streptomyces sp. NPDC102441]|uniref:siderophore-interacting protein n=1 Tax=Streptomyces sp. NPDC102441 TaxID=3366176 RepID=UPI00381EDD47
MLPKVQSPKSRRMITLEVRRTTVTTPNFLTVTLGGPEIGHLLPTGSDQGVRLFFPRAGQAGLTMPTLSSEAWMAQVLLLPKSRRPWVRNYTVRRIRPESAELDIEFALHGDTPACSWALGARPGDPAGVFDIGMTYLPPADAVGQLLVADESAVPAVLAILEDAPASLVAEVFLEVPETADIRKDAEAPEGVRVHWLARDGSDALPGRLALDAVKAATLPPGRSYTWAAGESGLVTGVRRHLVRDRGVPKPDIAFHGYWRNGRSSPG